MTYDTTLEEFRCAIKLCGSARNTITNDQVEEYTNTLQYLLENGHSPDTVWNFLDNGSYKEVYVPSSKTPFVLKFCAADNDTAAEEGVIKGAHIHGLERLFVPTYFIKLPTSLPAAYLDVVWSYSSPSGLFSATWSNMDQLLNFLEVQPRIQVYQAPAYVSLEHQNELWYEVLYGEDCNCKPADPDIAHQLRRFIPYSDFAEKLYRFYPNEVIKQFVLFMEDYGISDLHGSNLGFMKEDGRPVILDWMSR